MELEDRFKHAIAVKQRYPEFTEFCLHGLDFLGFKATRMQLHIALALQNASDKEMIQAPRGIGKTMVTALYAIHTLVQDPTKIIMIFSAYGDKAEEIGRIIYQLIHGWKILEYLQPDTSKKDLNSASKFDVHYALKGFNQSPSVSCVGITASTVGKRANLIISDDVEVIKNSETPAMRDKLERYTQEFASIVTHGRILYLGTPQTKDSIYNRLPSKGYKINTFTARYPSNDEIQKYGSRLASYILEDIQKHGARLQTGGGLSGKMGQPTDARYSEDDLVSKEIEWGSEGFALQYMLNTDLSDAVRQQLRLSDLIVANFGLERLPESINWIASQEYQTKLPDNFVDRSMVFYNGIIPKCEWQPSDPKKMWCYLDPAGGGGDELAWSIGTSQAPYIHWLYTAGVRGGLTEKNTDTIIDSFIKFKVTRVMIETNMGHGLFEINLSKSISDKQKEYEKQAKTEQDPVKSRELFEKADILKGISIESEFSTSQKERRIIDSLVSTMQRHYLVVHGSVFESDTYYNQQYGVNEKAYSVFHQMENITLDRGSLVHDDRLESVAGLVRMFKYDLSVDEEKASEKRREARSKEVYDNPMGYTKDILAQQNKGYSTRSRTSSMRGTRGRVGRPRK